MQKPFIKLFIIMTMLVAFVGQAMAFSFMGEYEQAAEHYSSEPSLSSNLNNPLNTEADTHEDDCCDVDCCEADCICPANVCAAFVYLDENNHSTELILLSDAVIAGKSRAPNSMAAVLYRPPIITS